MMKTTLFAVSVVAAGCTQPMGANLCEDAIAHSYECGVLPSFGSSCEEASAVAILDQSCEQLQNDPEKGKLTIRARSSTSVEHSAGRVLVLYGADAQISVSSTTSTNRPACSTTSRSETTPHGKKLVTIYYNPPGQACQLTIRNRSGQAEEVSVSFLNYQY